MGVAKPLGKGCEEEVTGPIGALQALKWVCMEHPHIAPGETLLLCPLIDVTQLPLLWERLLTRTKYIKIVNYILSHIQNFPKLLA